MRNRLKLGIVALLTALGFPIYWLLTYCSHDFSTWPQTRTIDGKKKIVQTCLKCGEEFEYDILLMRRKNSLGKSIGNNRRAEIR